MKRLFLLFLLTISINPPVNGKEQWMTLRQTVELSRVGSVKVSPNGRHLAYTKIVPRKIYQDSDGKSFIDLYVKTGSDTPRAFITGKQRVGNLAWGPKSHFIYFLAQRLGDKYVGVYRIAVDGGEAQKLFETEFDISAFTISSQGTSIIYLSEGKEVNHKQKLEALGFKAKVYEEADKKTRAYLAPINEKSSKHSMLDIEQNILSVEYHPTANKLLIKASPSALVDDQFVASQYQIVKPSGKLIKKIKTTGKLGAARWSKDGKRIAIIAAADKNDPAAGRLIIADAKSGKIERLLTEFLGQLKGVEWLSNDQLALLTHTGTKSEISVFNIDSRSITSKHVAGDEVITAIHADLSGRVFVGVGSSDSHPKELLDLSGKTIKRLTTTNPELKDVAMPKQITIKYLARDGVELEGILIYPIGYRRNKKYPLIMMVHGGPESHVSDGWIDRYTYPIKNAAARGFAVFLPNYRGSTGRGVEFSKMGQADYAGKEFDDLVDAISHLSKMGIVDKRRVGITGASYGGYASAWAATALSKHFAASVMFAGVSDQVSKFGTTDVPTEIYDVHARSYPWEKWQWMLERSPIYHTDKAKTPILIMHGESDVRVNFGQSMELYRYIKTRTDTPVRLVLYPKEGHGNDHNAAQLDYSIRLMRWMEFYLKGRKKHKKMPPYEIDHGIQLGGE